MQGGLVRRRVLIIDFDCGGEQFRKAIRKRPLEVFCAGIGPYPGRIHGRTPVCGPGTTEADQHLNGPSKRDVLPCRPLVGCDLGSGRGDPGGGVNHRVRPKPSASGLGIPGWRLFHAGGSGNSDNLEVCDTDTGGASGEGHGGVRQGRRTFLAALPKRISRQSRFRETVYPSL